MSNRTDFHELAHEILSGHNQLAPTDKLTERIETELHNALVAGKEGSKCGCSSCKDSEEKLWWALEEAGLSGEEILKIDPEIRRKLVSFFAPLTVRRLTR
jgi:hypothetical protein